MFLESFSKTQGGFRAARWDVQKLAKTQKPSGPQTCLRVLFALRPQNVIKAERNIVRLRSTSVHGVLLEPQTMRHETRRPEVLGVLVA